MRVTMIAMAFAFVSLLQARPVEACTCVHFEGCGATRPTDVMFEATVESIEPEQPPTPRGNWASGRKVVRFKDVVACLKQD